MPPRPIRAALLAWYDAHARPLPWRVSPVDRARGVQPDPYRVWLSEVMLQQTTVPHATPYFQKFLQRWPTVADLAAERDEVVMAAWAGLGYYARARNLLACARAVASEHDGTFPDTEAGLLRLPGVGAYTAAAMAAIAFDRPANVVDGNVERVMARLWAVEAPLPEAKPQLKALAGALVSDDRPGDWAQALMDLGATICRPKAPLCAHCPLAAACQARATGAPEAYPRRSKRADRPHRLGAVFIRTAHRRSHRRRGSNAGRLAASRRDRPCFHPLQPYAAGLAIGCPRHVPRRRLDSRFGPEWAPECFFEGCNFEPKIANLTPKFAQNV